MHSVRLVLTSAISHQLRPEMYQASIPVPKHRIFPAFSVTLC
jgi:hypothetical protein